MTDDVGYRLFVHATVQKRCHKIVPQRMEMVLLWETDRLIDFSQTLREGVRVDEPSVLIGEEIGSEFAVCVLCRCFLPLVIAAKDPTQVRGKIDFSALAVLGGSLHDALAGDAAAGATDGEKQAVFGIGEVGPAQSAQLSATAAGVHGEQIEQAVVPRFFCQCVQQFLHFPYCRDALDGALRQRQVNHPGRVLADDLVPFRIGQHCRDHGQILLYGLFLNHFSPALPLPQLHHHVFQCHGPQTVQLDSADVGIGTFQHPAVAGQSAGGVFRLPV